MSPTANPPAHTRLGLYASRAHVYCKEAVRTAIENTVGPSGINIGGGVALGIHYAAEWQAQIHSDSADGFVRVRSFHGDVLQLTQKNHAPIGMFDTTSPSLKSNAIF